MNKKNLIILVILVVIVLFGVYWSKLSPVAPTDNYNWQTFDDQTNGVVFEYPEDLKTQYISLVDWPPKVTVSKGSLVCVKDFCETIQSGGAAGSTYNQYTYTFSKNNLNGVLNFTLRLVQCANYDDPQKSACENERQAFKADTFVASLIASTKLSEPTLESLPK